MPINMDTMPKYEDESVDEMAAWIKETAKSDRPFFIYWASYAHQVAGGPPSTASRKALIT